jgi:hypothetical protein
MDRGSEQDPRVYFAAERTFLAWIRTGLGLIGIGFAVSRFGLFFRQLSASESHLAHSRHWPVRLVWGNTGGLRRGRHPQFRPATFSTDSRVKIRHLDTGTRVEGCRSAGTAVGWRRDRNVYIFGPRTLAT